MGLSRCPRPASQQSLFTRTLPTPRHVAVPARSGLLSRTSMRGPNLQPPATRMETISLILYIRLRTNLNGRNNQRALINQPTTTVRRGTTQSLTTKTLKTPQDLTVPAWSGLLSLASTTGSCLQPPATRMGTITLTLYRSAPDQFQRAQKSNSSYQSIDDDRG